MSTKMMDVKRSAMTKDVNIESLVKTMDVDKTDKNDGHRWSDKEWTSRRPTSMMDVEETDK